MQYSKGFTHNGKFHADEVFSTALLKLINPEFDVLRGSTAPEEFDGIIYDIGGGEFDHHMENKRTRENGIPYAAFGLLWEKYGLELVDKEGVIWFDEHFVQPLDDADNNGAYSDIAIIIREFNPTWDSKKTEEEAFEEAVDMAMGILGRKIESYNASIRANKLVAEKIKDHPDEKILVLEECIPWKKAVIGTEIEYVIFPSNRGGYCIQAVPEADDKELLKHPFPEDWRGKSSEELEKITGIEGFRFCHTSGFLCSVDTYEAAVRVAECAMKGV